LKHWIGKTREDIIDFGKEKWQESVFAATEEREKSNKIVQILRRTWLVRILVWRQ
jgi:hypothetical protein